MQKSRFTKLSYEDKFDRKYACWTRYGWRKYKRANRRMARRKLKRELLAERILRRYTS